MLFFVDWIFYAAFKDLIFVSIVIENLWIFFEYVLGGLDWILEEVKFIDLCFEGFVSFYKSRQD